ncbi:hypothetical protein HanHA300_Chr10g0367601 [Helianthus annuus]|nr:hypothetical protein HanHA300_Chr10g0367601 [Helianthus annuus]KAJ0530400.1 hypothetical protein HanHA89_Chr10g0389471 [Helianthus annuus]
MLCILIRGGPKPSPRWAGAPPGKKNLVLSSGENPVRTPWNFSSAPLGIFRPHPFGKSVINLYFKIFFSKLLFFFKYYLNYITFNT